MKGYLITTGSLFGLAAAVHVLKTIAERSRLASDHWFILEGPGFGLFAGALSAWAWRLVFKISRARNQGAASA